MKHTILSSQFCLFQNSLIDHLFSKGSCFIAKKENAVLQKKKKGFWTKNPFFSGLRMYFYRLWYWIWSDCCLLHLNHVSLGLTFLDHVTPYLIDFFKIFTGGGYHRDMKALKILPSNPKYFRIYGIFKKWQYFCVFRLTF